MALTGRRMSAGRLRPRGKLSRKRGCRIIRPHESIRYVSVECCKEIAVLEIRVLGGLDVIRDGVAVTLPPSRKTRALLVYHALTRSWHRREELCEIFWDVPDDSRGSLRWSLSKIRPLVDEPAISRLAADR
jgi:hypothetical protein